MLLPDNVHPEDTIYYNGTIVLSVLLEVKSIDIIDLFQKVKTIKNIIFRVFILTLDWLYLIDIAVLKEGKIELCS